MSDQGITDELVYEIADELRSRYGLDDEDIIRLGKRLADSARPRGTNEFAERFTQDHRDTFDRLAD